ncbi:uncharacterized protein PSFLO_03894 [Pseudozyma flocculosa]|uniref:Uncharacterized protein n=1 Tax=Pseudozyma flocculosa TaxID=84751 RepID=A0A5C3F3A9_9BASI|nr:uncharacterized protein PSFLO_03894 [Pseudozyma flocculosa]
MTLNVGDRVLFNVGRGAEEGIVQGFHIGFRARIDCKG